MATASEYTPVSFTKRTASSESVRLFPFETRESSFPPMLPSSPSTGIPCAAANSTAFRVFAMFSSKLSFEPSYITDVYPSFTALQASSTVSP